MLRARSASHVTQEALVGWQLAEADPALGIDSPADLEKLNGFREAQVPGTVASALRAAGQWSFDSVKDFDDKDYFYRVSFPTEPVAAGESLWLCFDGLATLCDVWLNGEHLLRSENMYVAHQLEVGSKLFAQNELVLKFSSLNVALGARRPRPRHRTRLVEKQQLRWFRTTFLGRMPSWTPPVVAVGPWRAVRLERRRGLSLDRLQLEPFIDEGGAHVRVHVELSRVHTVIQSVTLRVGAQFAELSPDSAQATTFAGELVLTSFERWWPNGHGPQTRYPAELVIATSDGEQRFELDPIGFRSIEQNPRADGFGLLVNGVELRCRGACWTPTDVVSLNDEASTVQAVAQAHAANMNMLRVGGTMIYESDAFYEECDRRGILVFQDYMFANCDYPVEDAAFLAEVRREAEQLLERTRARACLAVLCGGSEVEQQISMLGLPKEAWKPPLFERELRAISNERRPDLPYLSSSPTGAGLPFQADSGVTHYYGVGAYLRPLEDARRAEVKFASECLAFANIPERQTLEPLLDGKAPFHDPRWKARVPRDNGPGWDFDDVRDFYVKLLFGVDPVLVRYQDPERALALGRVASGEVMARTLLEWRRAASSCRGSLIWLFRDLWPGAGWGIVDANGVPKAAYYAVRRALAPRVVFLSDEGVNGLTAHVINDSAEPLSGQLELTLWRTSTTTVVARGAASVSVAPFSTWQLASADLFDHFFDLTHAYRFGPPAYDVAVATLKSPEGAPLTEDTHYFVGQLPSHQHPDVGLSASAVALDESIDLRVSATSFAQSVSIDVPGYVADDSYFHLSPGQERSVRLQRRLASAKPRGHVQALNGHVVKQIRFEPNGPQNGQAASK